MTQMQTTANAAHTPHHKQTQRAAHLLFDLIVVIGLHIYYEEASRENECIYVCTILVVYVVPRLCGTIYLLCPASYDRSIDSTDYTLAYIIVYYIVRSDSQTVIRSYGSMVRINTGRGIPQSLIYTIVRTFVD